jgi:LysM repeat protein
MRIQLPFILLTALILAGCSTSKQATSTQVKNISQARDDYERYVLTYYPIAVEQMTRHNIPASITLAQGLLESGAGKSKLSRSSNNHFGIKADKNWTGKRTSSMDNGKLCYFRKYDNVRDSYEDHSSFLVNRQRYASLFSLKKTDYKGWAKGLRKAGYAEDPAYPTKLISLIERYELYRYDSFTMKDVKKASGVALETHEEKYSRTIYKANGLLYIIGDTGDTFKSLSKEFGTSQSKLIKYNDLYKGYNIKAGDIIYLEEKNSKTDKQYPTHTVNAGESMHYISQKYGIKLDKLYKNNPEYIEKSIKSGDIIRLR